MGIPILTIKQFLSFGKKQVSEMTKDEFLKEYWADLDGCGTMGWRFENKETTNIEEAEEWYKKINT